MLYNAKMIGCVRSILITTCISHNHYVHGQDNSDLAAAFQSEYNTNQNHQQPSAV